MFQQTQHERDGHGKLPEALKRPARAFRSFCANLALGFMMADRNLGGSPYRKMLSVNSRMAQMWIHALKACRHGKWLEMPSALLAKVH